MKYLLDKEITVSVTDVRYSGEFARRLLNPLAGSV